MVTVQIDESDLLDMLVERVKYWTDEKSTVDLFAGYYQSMIDGGCFDGAYLNVSLIVDNDYNNNLSVYDSIEKACNDFNCTAEELNNMYIIYQDENGILVPQLRFFQR